MSKLAVEEGKQEILNAQTAMELADKTDPVIKTLCLHLDAVIYELSRQRMIHYILEDQLHQLGIDLTIEE